jgi:hemolysin activation/secretion protein
MIILVEPTQPAKLFLRNAIKIWAQLFVPALYICDAQAQRIPESVRREAQRLEERESERLRERERVFQDSQIRPPSVERDDPEVKDVPVSEPCMVVKRIELSGMTRYRISDYSENLRRLQGICTKAADIDRLLRAITNRYVAAGYITSRALRAPEPDDKGTVKVVVVEGSLGKISDAKTPSGHRYGSAMRSAFPGLVGRQLNLRDLEQGVDQLARLNGSEPSIDIVPGTAAGTSDIVVKRLKTKPWVRPSLTFNNDGSARTGRRIATASLDLDNPLGLADFWSFYYVRDIEGEGEQGIEGYGGFVSVPYGYTTLIVSGGRYRFDSVLDSNGLRFSNTGDSFNGSITLDHVLFRDRKSKISVAGSIAFYDTTNRIQDIRLSTNSYRVVSGQVAFRIQRRVGAGVAIADFTFTRGFDVLGANAADIGPGSDGLKFRKLEASLAYQARVQTFGLVADYSASLRGQWALDPVLPAERLSIGGSSTVRGFRDDGISGRTGATFRQQISVGLAKLFSDAQNRTATQLSTIIGYDAGAILPRTDDPFERGFLQSSTLGLRLANTRMLAEISVAFPLSAPAAVQRSRFEVAASVRLTI